MSDVATIPRVRRTPPARGRLRALPWRSQSGTPWADRRLWLIVGLALVLRAPGLDRPLLGNFATKNVAYAMIAQNWATGQASLWHPTLHVLRDGKPGLHLLEVPVAAYVAGGLWYTLGGSLDFWGRAVSVGCIAVAVGLLYVLVRRWHGAAAAAAAAVALAISPVSIIYGQSFMLEASAVLFSIAALDAADRFGRGASWWWMALAAASLGLLVLSKIYMAVMLLPLAHLACPWRKPASNERPRHDPWASGTGKPWRVAAALTLLALALLPAAAWYVHVMAITADHSPVAGQVFYSLRDSQRVHRWPPDELFRADFYRQLLDDLSTVVLTPIGFTLLVIGGCRREARQHLAWLAAAAVLVLVLPRKFYAMNYYFLPILPPLAVLVGLGWKTVSAALAKAVSDGEGSVPSETAARVWPRDRLARRAVPAVLLAAALLLSLRYAAKPAFITPEEDRSVLAAAEACRKLVSQGETVATLHGTTIDLLYYCNRRGWVMPPAADRLPQAAAEAARQGARYLVVAHLRGLPAETRRWLQRLPHAAAGDDYAVYDLRSLDPTPLADRRR